MVSASVTEQSSLVFIMYLIFNIQNVYLLIFATIIATTFLFAREFQDRTYIYLFIRSVSWTKLFIAKINAVILFIAEVVVVLLLISGTIGMIMWEMKPISEFDIGIASSIGRVLVYGLITIISFIFTASIAAMMSVLLRNQLSSIIGSAILFLICIVMMISVFSENEYSYTPFYYIFFSQYIRNLSFENIVAMAFRSIIIFAGYSVLSIGIAYRISSGIRKGNKNV